MRSVSIVYRKGRRQSCGQLTPIPTNPRRSVDQYYTRLVEKGKSIDRINNQKQLMIDRMKLKTSNNHRRSDKFNIIDTLSIVPAALHEQLQDQQKKQQIKTLQKMYINKKKQPPKTITILKGLNFTPYTQHQEQQQTNQSKFHCKLKCLFKQKTITECKDIIVTISVNFIFDQHSFWQQENVDQSIIKHWRTLQNCATIVWLCQKEQTIKKLVKFSKSNGVRLDAVYVILPRNNKKMLTVSFNSIQTDFGIKFHKSSSPLLSRDQKKLIVINGLLVQSTSGLNFSNFFYSIPIIKNCRSVVHYTKVDPNDKLRFGLVIKILSEETRPKPFNILAIIDQYENYQERNQLGDCNCDISDFSVSKVDLLAKMDETKKDFMKYFSQSLSVNLNQKVTYEESQNSTQFIIGDILRRNYKIIQQFQRYTNQYREYQHHQKIHLARESSPRRKARLPIKKYRNQVYLWQV